MAKDDNMSGPKKPGPRKGQRQGLGRGIGVLIGDDRPAALSGANGDSGPRQQLPIAYISPGSAQPRQIFNDMALDELTASIAEKGVLQPLIVRELSSDHYELIAGERRWRAAQKAGLHHVPVVIQDYSDRDALEVAIIENVQRADLTPAEEARAYRRLMDDYQYTQDDMAKVVGKSRSHIGNLLRLLHLPDSVLELLDEGALTMGHARAIIGQSDADKLARKIVAEGLSVRAVEAMVKAGTAHGSKAKPAVKPRTKRKDADTVALEKSMAAALSMPVKINHQGNDGQITISYPSLEALDDLLEKLGVSL